jgi:hypothetical protein
MANTVDARLKIALVNAKKGKAERIRYFKEMATVLEPVGFELTGFVMKGHRRAWFQKLTADFVTRVFMETRRGALHSSQTFVCHRFILETTECWKESGFAVTITEEERPQYVNGISLTKDEILVTTRAVLCDSSKPFAAYVKAIAHKAEDLSIQEHRDITNYDDAVERIHTAILNEAGVLARAGYSAISMPTIYQLRKVRRPYSAGNEYDNRVFKFSRAHAISGIPYESLDAFPQTSAEKAFILPLDEAIFPDTGIWKVAE